MFFKKKKKETVQNVTKFEIPQIISPYQGIKKSKDSFEQSVFSSAIYGTGIKDKATYHDSSEELGDIGRRYDSFRDPREKKFTDEDSLRKYGSKFPEFQKITLETAKEVYGEEITINKKKIDRVEESVQTPTFSFIKSAADVVKNEEIKEEKIEDNNQFNFNEEIKEENNPFDFSSFNPNLESDNNQQPQDYFNGHFNKNGEFSNSNTSIVRKKRGYDTSLFNTNKVTGTDNNKIEIDEEYEKNYTYNPSTQENKNAEFNSDFNDKLNAYKNEEIKQNPYSSFEPKKENNEHIEAFKSVEEFKNYDNDEPDLDNNVSYIEPTSFEMPTIINPYKDYVLPGLDLFSKDNNIEEGTPDWIEEKKNLINELLQSFGISGEVEKYVVGPTFTRFEILLETGVNVKKIVNLQDNIQMDLGVSSIRIQAPIPGKRTVGIEVPNDKRKTVLFGDTLSEEFINDGKPLNVVLGKDIDGNVIYSNIAKWPHGLIAGSTGSGKSVCINTVIISLLLKCKPDEVKFIMIDPKQVELAVYNDIPHLITPVISDPKMASAALKWAVNEMERRFSMFANVRARDMESYNEKVKDDPTLQKMCYIVIIIDELADLMMTCSQDVEASIQRITQKARAAGIHLIAATQRPTVDVVKGTIKANIQARLAFRVNSQTDSLTILDEVGAESLLGRGDMLLKEVDIAKRVQGSFIPDDEIEKVVEFIASEAQPDYQLTHNDLKSSEENDSFTGMTTTEESTDLIYNIAVWCCESQSCSINSIQQNFSLGFNRAQRIVQALEDMGIVSEKKGTRRDILMNLDQINDLFERGE